MGSATGTSEVAICDQPTRVPSLACRVIREFVAAAPTKPAGSNVTERSASTCNQVVGCASEFGVAVPEGVREEPVTRLRARDDDPHGGPALHRRHRSPSLADQGADGIHR